MKVAVIGAGNVGRALGDGLGGRGHDVVYGVRPGSDPAAGARTASPREAAACSDVVVLATPWAALESVVRDLGDLGSRVLLDATNPIAPGFKLAVGHTTSGAEVLQALAPRASRGTRRAQILEGDRRLLARISVADVESDPRPILEP